MAGVQLLALLAGPVGASIVVERLPLRTGGPGADTLFDLFESPYFERSADEFVVSEPVTIRRVNWWGFYGGTFDEVPEPAPMPETMRIRLYRARVGDGLPDEGDMVYEQSFVNPSRIATGELIATGPAPPEYFYSVDLATAVVLDAATVYWLEIAQEGDEASLFRWEVSPLVGEPFAFVNPSTVDWRRTAVNANLAFQLSSVPEPSTGALMIIGTVVAGIRRSRREARRR